MDFRSEALNLMEQEISATEITEDSEKKFMTTP